MPPIESGRSNRGDTILTRMGEMLAVLSQRWVPDAFVFAVILTLAVYLMGLVLTDRGPYELVEDWYGGFWNLLQFAMQMTLVLVTGYALASSNPVRRALEAIASVPRGGPSAIGLTALVAGVLGWVHWGLGLVAGALLAREMAASAKRRGIAVHFPLLAAAGYLGLAVWHSGLSGSAPLLVNTAGHFLEAQIGTVPLSETTLRPFNLLFVGLALLVAPLLLMGMHPAASAAIEPPPDSRGHGGGAGSRPPFSGPGTNATPAERLSESRALVWVVAAAAAAYLVPFFARSGIVGLDLNVVNFAFLMAGLLLHGTLASYARAAADGARAASAVIIQFPFYAGIMGIMINAGLVTMIADAFIALSTPLTFPFWVMVSAAAINFAIPSGGGQWAVQGPIVVEAANAMGLDLGRAIMAVAMGDQITNMIQPFWALPLLGITGLRAGQVLGYTAAVMVVVFVIAAPALVWLP